MTTRLFCTHGIHSNRHQLINLKDVVPHTHIIETNISTWKSWFPYKVRREAMLIVKEIQRRYPNQEPIHLTGHSAGSLVMNKVAEILSTLSPEVRNPVRSLILINPALDARYELSHYPERIFCLHDTEDKLTLWGSRLPFHPFGKMGRVGYRGPLPVISIDMNPYLKKEGILDHSSILLSQNYYVCKRLILHCIGYDK